MSADTITGAPSLGAWDADLETLNAAATPGKWVFEHMRGVSFAGLYSDDATGSIIAKFGGFEFAHRPGAETDANCALAAALVNAYREGRMARAADAEHYMRLASESAEIIARHPEALAQALAATRLDAVERCAQLVGEEIRAVGRVEAKLLSRGHEDDSLPYAGQRAALMIMADHMRGLVTGGMAYRDALAAARAEGRVAGLEEAAATLVKRAEKLVHDLPPDSPSNNLATARKISFTLVGLNVAKFEAEAIRALISPPTPAQTDTAPGERV